MSDDQYLRIAQQFIEALPHARVLGLRLLSVSPGHAEIELPWAAHLVGDPATGVLHGGAVSTLMDTCGGAAVMAHPAANAGAATLDLRIDYMRAATPGQAVRARAECLRVTRSVAFVRATASDDDVERPVALMQGAFTLHAPRLAGEAT